MSSIAHISIPLLNTSAILKGGGRHDTVNIHAETHTLTRLYSHSANHVNSETARHVS